MIRKALFWLVTVAVMLAVAGPLLWIFLTAYKAANDIFTTELSKIFVFTPTLENFHRLFTAYPFWKNLGNTAIVSVISTIIVMIVSLPAAYSFSRWNTGGGHLLFTTISTRMFPGVVAAIPFFASIPTTILAGPYFATASRTKSGFSTAAVPSMTRPIPISKRA